MGVGVGVAAERGGEGERRLTSGRSTNGAGDGVVTHRAVTRRARVVTGDPSRTTLLLTWTESRISPSYVMNGAVMQPR